MIWAACQAMPAEDTLFNDGPLVLAFGSLVISLFFAAALAPFVRRRYRNKVTRLMGLNQLAAPAPDSSTPLPEATTPRRTFKAEGLATVATQREKRIQRASLAAWAAFVGAALLLMVIKQDTVSDGLGFVLLMAVVGTGALQNNWPARQPWRAKGLLACSVALTVLMCWALWPDAQDKDFDDTLATALLLGPLFGAGYFVSFQRSLRGQVLPVFTLALCSVLGYMLLIGWAEQAFGTCWSKLDSGEAGPWAGAGHQLLIMLPTLLGLWLGFAALAGMARSLERGWVNEVSLVSLANLAFWAATVSTAYVSDKETMAASWAPLLLLGWVAATVGAYALALGRPPDDGPGPQLLVLRVFSHHSRHHDLLDVVQGRWRMVGAVHQIGGPDMVALNVDPYESMKFLANRLHELFLPSGISLSALQARLHTRPDKEGRYRINEVFCFNTAWQATVVQLMQLSDVIVLDVRNMKAERHGTGFEISQLAQRGLLSRVVAVGDRDTDWAHVDTLMHQAGQDPATLQRLTNGDEDVAEALFQRLLGVAACPSPGANLGSALAQAHR